VAEFIPFRGFRYDTQTRVRPIPLSDLICPPYDVIDEAERERLYARSPYNFVRVEFPKDGPDDKYKRAARDLAEWIRGNVLGGDECASFYLHEHEFEIAGRRLVRRGIFGAQQTRAHQAAANRPSIEMIAQNRLRFRQCFLQIVHRFVQPRSWKS